MKLTTFATTDGPFTVLIDGGAVLASGWTASAERILGRVRPAQRPSSVAVVDPKDPEVAAVGNKLAAYYGGDLSAIDQVPVRHFGTPGQLAGWARLRQITPGHPLSYTEFATALGNPAAVRAAAGICARNAVALFVPCHRVLRNDGTLGGFAWGVEVKSSLLARESLPATQEPLLESPTR